MAIPNNIPSNRTFGVEIEFIGITQNKAVEVLVGDGINACLGERRQDSSHSWRIVSDGSLESANGSGECVSPVLRGIEGLLVIEKVLKSLRRAGATVNKSCGLHVHVGARDLNMAECAAVMFSYGANEAHFDSVVQASRRRNTNNFCYSVNYSQENVAFFDNAARNVNSSRMISEFWRSGRYNKVNLRALADHGTIEFRQHGGTIDASKVCNWVCALLGFVEHTVTKFRAEAINVIAASYPTASSVFQQRGYVPMNYGQQRMANLLQAEQGNFLTINTLARSARVTDGTASSYMSIIKRWAISRGGRIERTRNVVNGVRHGYKFRFTMTPVPVVQAPVTPVREGAITMSQLLATTARTSMTFEAIFGLAGADVLGFFLERKEDLR